MVELVAIGTTVLVASLLQQQSGTVVLVIGLLAVGVVSWRSKRGDFYKEVAEEKTAEADKLRDDNEKLRNATDIRPILRALENVTAAVERSNRSSEAVIAKVADMNGSLRAHATAMEALADRIVLDEAARGLLAAAAEEKPRTPRRRSTS